VEEYLQWKPTYLESYASQGLPFGVVSVSSGHCMLLLTKDAPVQLKGSQENCQSTLRVLRLLGLRDEVRLLQGLSLDSKGSILVPE
jgi:hypothetical protein